MTTAAIASAYGVLNSAATHHEGKTVVTVAANRAGGPAAENQLQVDGGPARALPVRRVTSRDMGLATGAHLEVWADGERVGIAARCRSHRAAAPVRATAAPARFGSPCDR
jgi:hypothetical protein